MERKRLLLAIMGFLVVCSVRDLSAIPSFAKKYGTSCATCHVAFPRLNAFGRAFLYNGYQFPGGREADADKVEEEQVKVGSESYKKVFPDAIWPNTIPAFSTFSMILESEATYLPDNDPKITFNDIPAEMEFLSGGNFQDNISWFAELEIKEGKTDLEVAHLSFDNIIKNNGMSLRVGKFVPILMPISHLRRLTASYWMATQPLGDNHWNFDRTQRGFEARGVFLNRRAMYSIGLVEGRKNLINGEKDFYIHGGYKVSGLPLDGSIVKGSGGATQPWMDNSIRFDGHFYRGTATLAEGHDDTFTQVGGSVDTYYNRLNFLLAFAFQQDDQPVVGEDIDGSGLHIFTEATYVLYPWLLPNFRYERFREKIGEESQTEQRVVPALITLIRANVKFVVLAEIEDGENGFDMDAMEFALAYGF